MYNLECNMYYAYKNFTLVTQTTVFYPLSSENLAKLRKAVKNSEDLT